MTTTVNRTIRSAVLAAAIASVPMLMSHSISAQNRVDTGNVLDANNRVGSGGNNVNDSYKRVGTPLNGNDVVTGNVSGGKEFRGQVPYTDPRAFRGQNASNGLTSDNFIRSSAGPDTRVGEQSQPFYGTSRAVAPPAGYQEVTPGSGAYVPPTNVVNRVQGDERLGALDLTNPQVALPQPGEMLMPGPLDPTAGQSYIFASPTAGIRTFSSTEISGVTSNTQYNPVGMKLDDASIQRMRDEMNAAAGISTPAGAKIGAQSPESPSQSPSGPPPVPGAVPITPGAPGIPGTPGTPGAPGAPAVPGAPGANPAQGATPLVAQPLAQQPIDNSVAAVPGSANTNQGIYFIPAPEKQSTLLADLRDKYQQKVADQSMSDEERARAFNNYQREKANPATPGQPGAAAAGSSPANGAQKAPAPGAAATSQPGANTPDFTKRGEDIIKGNVDQKTKQDLIAKHGEPVKVPSLAKDMKGKGLADFMQAAEAAMKEGKFTLAFEDYDKAEQVAPNNYLIKLGRANAELGASYYSRAESHLHDVFTAHPELLLAQYDLTSMLGEQRLKTLIKDLKELSKKDTHEPRPLFLLSYIAYNTGHEQEAQGYLDLADKRSGGANPFYKLLRDNWSLPNKPAAPPVAPDANK